MEIYDIRCIVDREFSLVYFAGSNKGALGFFLLNKLDKRFERGYPLRLLAQEDLRLDDAQVVDFYDSVFSFPIFSRRAFMFLEEVVRGQMSFYPCLLQVHGVEMEVFAGRIINRRSVFSMDFDFFPSLLEGFCLREDDLIVRDEFNPQFYFVTEKFKNLCESAGLKMMFKNFKVLPRVP
jgi:hypothetical protein